MLAEINDQVIEALKDAIGKCYRCDGSGIDKMRTRVIAWGPDVGKEITHECAYCKPWRDALTAFETAVKTKRNNDTFGMTDV